MGVNLYLWIASDTIAI